MFLITSIRPVALFILLVSASASVTAQPSSTDERATQLFNKATEQYTARQYDAAIANYTEYLKLKPNSSAAYFNRGLSLYNKAQAAPTEALYRQAAADFSKAIEIKPNDAEYWTSRGSVYIRLMTIDYVKSLAQALSDFDKAIKINPKSALAYRERGVAYEISNQLAKALPDLNTAIRLDPKDAVAYYTRAKVHGGSKRYAAAKADAETALKLFPNYEAAKIYRDYMNGEMAKAAAAAKAPKPRTTPAPRATPRPTPARTAARTQPTPKPPAPRPTPRPVPVSAEQDAASLNNALDAYQKTDGSSKRGDHKAVIAYSTRGIQLIPVNRQGVPNDELMQGTYIALLNLRARAHAALNDQNASFVDYEKAVDVSLDVMNRHLRKSNDVLEKDGSKAGIAALLMSGFEMDRARSVCTGAVEIADEWRISANKAQPTGMAGVRAGMKLMAAREICVDVHISRANAVASRMAFETEARRKENQAKAIEILTAAIKFAGFYAKLYTERAKFYRITGQTALAAADEAKARELSAPKKN